MYLIHYPSPNNVLRYDVRAYDLQRERLLARPIVDPREPDERMSGPPVTRATGPGARWEYTLYQGPEYAFIHALDTERREAFCIDLEGLDGYPGGMWGLKLEPSSHTLAVVAGRRTLATVVTGTLEAEVAGVRPAAAPSEDEPKSAGVPWLLVLAPTLLLFAGLALLGRRGHQAASA
jgi:hypothetical protein